MRESVVTIAKKALLVIDEVQDAYKDDERVSAKRFKDICRACAWKFSELRRPFSGEENGVECAVDLALEMCSIACRDMHVGNISDNSGIEYLETMECIFAGVLDAQGGGEMKITDLTPLDVKTIEAVLHSREEHICYMLHCAEHLEKDGLIIPVPSAVWKKRLDAVVAALKKVERAKKEYEK